MSSLGDKRDQWLAAFDWEAVTAMNAGLCAKTGSLHRPTSDGHEPCRAKWVASYRDEMSFRETLEFLKASLWRGDTPVPPTSTQAPSLPSEHRSQRLIAKNRTPQSPSPGHTP